MAATGLGAVPQPAGAGKLDRGKPLDWSQLGPDRLAPNNLKLHGRNPFEVN